MKRGCLIVLFISLLCFNLVFADEAILAPSNVTVTVDADPPIIDIYSPGSTTYNNATPLLFNYSVIDLSPDSEWYSLNSGNNITSSSPFYLELAEGDYNLKIYANDSFSRVNFSEVDFIINNSVPYCGDNTCNNGEDCSTCSSDCGICPEIPTYTPSGGGGDTRVVYSKDVSGQFTIDKEIITVFLNSGETEEEYIIIKNLGKENLDLNIEITESIKPFVRISETKFTLEPGENKTIAVDFIALSESEPDLYFGSISVVVEDVKKSILIALEVESNEPLFDVRVIIPEKFITVMPGEELLAQVEIIDVAKVGIVDIRIEKVIKDSGGDILLEIEDTKAVEGRLDYIDTIQLPSDIKPDKYVLYYTVFYDGQFGVGSDIFEVKERYDIRIYILFAAVIVILLILFYYIIDRIREKKENIIEHIKREKKIIGELSREKKAIESHIQHLDKKKIKIGDKWKKEKIKIEEDFRKLKG